jgi:hypothetical protein
MGYERAVRTLRREATDCVATWGGWMASASFFEYVTGKRFWDAPRSVAIEAWRKLEVDMVSQNTILPAGPDDWRTFPEPEVQAVRHGIKSAEDVVAYVELLPNPDQLEREFDFEASLTSVRSRYLQLQKEVERIVAAAGAGGGLAIGTANTAAPDCLNENLEALFRYPHQLRIGE